MIEQEGRVRFLDGEMAEVVIARQSACGACQAKTGCGTAVVGSLFPARTLTLRLPNAAQAAIGDRIVVGLPEAALQVAALLLYGLPLLALIVSAIAAQAIAEAQGWSTEPLAVAGGLLGLIAGLWAARRLSGLGGMKPVMLRRLPACEVGINTLTS